MSRLDPLSDPLSSISFVVLWAVIYLCITVAGYLLGRLFDRWYGGSVGRLVVLSTALAAVTSTLLLLVPLYVEDVMMPGSTQLIPVRRNAIQMRGTEALALAAVPVAIAALPLLAEPLLRLGRLRQLAYVSAAALRVLATVLLISFIVQYGGMALVGFCYLPSVAAMGAAVIRTWSPNRQPAITPTWQRTSVVLAIPVLLVLAFFAGTFPRGTVITDQVTITFPKPQPDARPAQE